MALCKTKLNGKEVYYFDDRYFTFQGKKFEIISSENTGRGVMEVKHTLKAESGETKEVNMKAIVDKLLSDPATEVVEK